VDGIVIYYNIPLYPNEIHGGMKWTIIQLRYGTWKSVADIIAQVFFGRISSQKLLNSHCKRLFQIIKYILESMPRLVGIMGKNVKYLKII
jgi:hypothetical protein